MASQCCAENKWPDVNLLMLNKTPLEFRFLVRKADYPVLYEHLSAYSDKVRATELCLLATRGLANRPTGPRPETKTIAAEALDQSMPLRFKIKASDFSEVFLHLQTFSVKTRAIMLCLLAQSALEIPPSRPIITPTPAPPPASVGAPRLSVPDDLDQFVMH
jgi:hypothetical protein